ncbi:MAG: DUF6166 domain-containing protein [Chloroflexota bacterium]
MDDTSARHGKPDFRQARHPTRVYSGVRGADECVVYVKDSALPEADDNPCVLEPKDSRAVVDYCERFDWGTMDSAALQLAVALLLDVTGEPERARIWAELFARKYVNNLPADWTVPEIDIDLWLYCFENARPGA